MGPQTSKTSLTRYEHTQLGLSTHTSAIQWEGHGGDGPQTWNRWTSLYKIEV